MSMDGAASTQFTAAHGQRAAALGYASPGLEIWGYPLQIVSDYRVSFVEKSALQPVRGVDLLRRIEYEPAEIIRTYISPDFTVREHIFIPIDKAAAIITYEVEGHSQPEIRVSFLPVMNLMWPAALGGQEVAWSETLHGFALQEQSEHFTAFVASPNSVTHTAVVNATRRQDLTQSMTLRPEPRTGLSAQAQVFIGLAGSTSQAQGSTLRSLMQQSETLKAEGHLHYEQLLQEGLRIETPDEAVNRAIAWSEVALDQAWVCNPQLGCGIVAGYGPSRGQRRPQYDWFFAGDGLVATEGLLAVGNVSRARDELVFILKYQNPVNGMIWHELSQSAGFLDWAGKYPYMFVHVDITFDFLSTMQHYLAISGDQQFVQQNWPHIQAAYSYCRSMIDPITGLPVVPSDKESGNEQTRMRDDLALSAAWLAASRGYAQLASATGHGADAEIAAHEAALTARSIETQYWNPATGFWLDGHTVSTAPSMAQRSRPAELLTQHVFSEAQQAAILDKLSSVAFQTDWGTRGLSMQSPGFNPDSYGGGSVSALGTANVASTLWKEHRPAAAWQIWSGLLPWFTIDSLGHMPELLNGDVFAEQIESVPEQTWSSAGFLQSTMQGLLGITIQAVPPKLSLEPHLPPEWPQVSIQRLHVGQNATLAVTLQQSLNAVKLTINNDGRPLDLDFSPQIPLGATNLRAEQGGHALRVLPERSLHDAQDEHARVALHVAHGVTTCTIRYSGGVEVWVPGHAVQPGDASTQIRLVGEQFAPGLLHVQWQAPATRSASLEPSILLRTPWTPYALDGSTLTAEGANLYRVTMKSNAVDAAANAQIDIGFH